MDPNRALSPGARLSGMRVIYANSDWSLAVGCWDGTGPKNRSLLIRWNGEGDRRGYPSTAGGGAWFVLPGEFQDAAMQMASETNAECAWDWLRGADDSCLEKLEKINWPLKNPES